MDWIFPQLLRRIFRLQMRQNTENSSATWQIWYFIILIQEVLIFTEFTIVLAGFTKKKVTLFTSIDLFPMSTFILEQKVVPKLNRNGFTLIQSSNMFDLRVYWSIKWGWFSRMASEHSNLIHISSICHVKADHIKLNGQI